MYSPGVLFCIASNMKRSHSMEPISLPIDEGSKKFKPNSPMDEFTYQPLLSEHMKEVADAKLDMDMSKLQLLEEELPERHMLLIRPLPAGFDDFFEECRHCKSVESQHMLVFSLHQSTRHMIEFIEGQVFNSQKSWRKFYIGITSSPSWRCRGGTSYSGQEVQGHFSKGNRHGWQVMHIIYFIGCQLAKRLEKLLIQYFTLRNSFWTATLANRAEGGGGISNVASDTDQHFYIYVLFG